MTPLVGMLAWFGIAVVVFPIVGWLAVRAGRSAARHNPGMASALMMLMTFAVFEPPPPPKAERVLKSEDGAGDPPET